MKFALASAALVAFSLPVVVAAKAPYGPAAQQSILEADAPLIFDVASIRENTSGEVGARQQFGAGRFTAVNTPLRQLILMAFAIQPFQLLGAPDWISAARFDIAATMPDGTPSETRRAMLRSLLAERFQLRTRIETGEMPIYALRVARQGTQLGPQDASEGRLRATFQDCG